MGYETDGWPTPAPKAPSKPQSFDDLINDHSGEDGEWLNAEAVVGTTAVLLLKRGDHKSARLLLDVVRAVKEWNDEHGENWPWLEVDSGHRAQFTDQVMNDVLRPVFMDVMRRRQYHAYWVDVRETLPLVGPDWRDQVQAYLSGKGVTNQGRRARMESPRLVEDNLTFTNRGELIVFKMLKKIQEQDFPRDDTIGVFPLPGARVLGHTWEPDILVTYKGRAGVIEIDGPHHKGRRALDATRDHLYRDAGVAVIDRIPVEVLSDASELGMCLRRFLKRLGEAR
ncbi:hypothetical protein [Nonomuraea aurantiaca]|uniref:hypothetical protein n=1 Tax=Nonomuraea aurantiaca TaxID=2878562 RepID=UPI001CDA53C4|nr:hypothetical protein [Nonomuraea aurantiaca]MCA2229646.1 hypothetical protein [Nonomuraea aurantiaca]